MRTRRTAVAAAAIQGLVLLFALVVLLAFWSLHVAVSGGIAVLLLALGIYSALRLYPLTASQGLETERRALEQAIRNLDADPSGGEGLLRSSRELAPQTQLRRIASEWHSASVAGTEFPTVAVTTEALRRRLAESGSTVRFIAGMAVYAGLFGTILGLAIAAFELRNQTGLLTQEDLPRFAAVVRDMMAGFSGAFAAAGAGVVVTLCLSYLLLRHDQEAEEFLAEAESFIANRLLPVSQALRDTVKPRDDASLIQKLVHDLDRVLLQTGDRMATALTHAEATAGHMRTASEALTEAARRIDQSSDGIRSASERIVDSATKIESGNHQIAAAIDGSQSRLSEAVQRSNESFLAVRDVVQAISPVLRESVEIIEQMHRAAQMLGTANDALRQLAPGVQQSISTAAGQMAGSLSASMEEMKAESEAVRELVRRHNDLVTQLAILIDELPSSMTVTVQPTTADRQVAAELTELRKQLAGPSQSENSLTQAIRALVYRLESTSGSTPAVPEGLERSPASLDLNPLLQEMRGLREDLHRLKWSDRHQKRRSWWPFGRREAS
ncbi:MAG TPA: methyl-accepting chemotaxis protein [Fimbriimonas sp.]